VATYPLDPNFNFISNPYLNPDQTLLFFLNLLGPNSPILLFFGLVQPTLIFLHSLSRLPPSPFPFARPNKPKRPGSPSVYACARAATDEWTPLISFFLLKPHASASSLPLHHLPPRAREARALSRLVNGAAWRTRPIQLASSHHRIPPCHDAGHEKELPCHRVSVTSRIFEQPKIRAF
jgi:hypothetical protein